ncbi:MAG TPA: extracellular solute-binding protein [Terriglobales bacterium]|nr:extracellular solute-binding protein [Terriglobales bacterium]
MAAVLTMAGRTVSRVVWLVAAGLALAGCSTTRTNTVTVYVSEDQVFSEPILRDFERETGIKVNAVFDTEEAKSTGVMNRLLAEKNNPQADVYWANEPVRADVLRQQGISAPFRPASAEQIPDQFKDPQGYWTGFSARARLLVVNKSASNKPTSVLDYGDPKTKGKGVIANPLFGTTTAQMAALFSVWGDQKGKQFLDGLKANKVKLAGSNGESADFVASGEFEFALVDSDDAVDRLRHGKPLEIVYPDQGEGEVGVLILPNAVALIRGGPNADNGKKLIEYLVSKETERKLAFADCAQIPLHPGVATPKEIKPIEQIKTMRVNYADLGTKLQAIQPILKQWVGY